MFQLHIIICMIEHIRRTIVADWLVIDPADQYAIADKYGKALAWLHSHDIYTSDLTNDGLTGLVAAHVILFKDECDLIAFTFMFGDLME
jgi:tRNA A-37 threonylcarbamoyl transferase component Bud32